ncbi:class D sortase [Ectobacillus ponti]|uniref:Class D sortase n=1 Tax=Ectobacillus ponti TaxID=2961894 RepID=A0AA42BNX2_9BACI|nr:class D sortase [Ectobacillus ponti]MCP8966984.1 class D sortase [Ectobacillus ponti]
MRKWLSLILIIVGIVLIGTNAWKWWDSRQEQAHAVTQASTVLAEAKERKLTRAEFQPRKNEEIGLLRIPKIDAVLPIVEGTDPDELKKGVGHFATAAFPGDKDQIVLSGHRDTVFRRFGELKEGDVFIVELPYGTFRYTMQRSKIVKADDTTVIQSTKPKEELVLTTCYPFRYVGSAPDRYIIYAYPEGS